MATLNINITASNGNLRNIVSQSNGILASLQRTANNLKIDLFNANSVNEINAIGGALTSVTNQIKSYTNEAIKGSDAWRTGQGQLVLEKLSSQLNVTSGNAQLFGQTVRNQQAELRNLQSALNSLLKLGYSATDKEVLKLKNDIDSLNQSLRNTSFNQFSATTGIISDLENKISRLRTALSSATSERSIAQYNIRLREAQTELERLRTIGISTTQRLSSSTSTLGSSAVVAARGYNAFGTEFARIIQDAPYAANNFGAIGNNITRMAELLPFYVVQLKATAAAQGQAATTANLLKLGFTGMFTGIGGLITVLSLAVTGFTVYQMRQQSVKREQDKLNGSTSDYISTLEAVRGALLKGTQNAQEDITNLRLLYKASINASLGVKARKEAVSELQSLYPKYFGNQTKEAVMAGNAKSAYDKLTASILASARARAAANKITENASNVLQNQSQIVDLTSQLNLADERLKKAREILSANIAAGQQSITAERELYNATEERNRIAGEINDKAKENSKYEQESANLSNQVNKELESGAKLAGGFGDAIENNNNKIEKQISLWDVMFENLKHFKVLPSPDFQGSWFNSGEDSLVSGKDQPIVALAHQFEQQIGRGAEKIGDDYYQALKRGIRQFSTDFYDTLRGLNQLADKSFKGIFSTLTTSLLSGFQDTVLSGLTNSLTDAFKDVFKGIDLKNLGKNLAQSIAAGASLVGGVISGASKSTSYVGQGIGGALTGAGAGFLTAGPIGAAIGGVVGLVGGLFGASAARKAEEQARKDEIEALKANTEQLRQNALAYASSIIGQATNQGIITNIDRNAFGDVVFRIQGKDLVATIDRNAAAAANGYVS